MTHIDEIIQMAIRIEENGFNFYQTLAKRTSNSAIRNVLLSLAAMEKTHEGFFKQLRNDYQTMGESIFAYPEGDAADYLNLISDKKVFPGIMDITHLEQVENDESLYNLAIEFEKENITFFMYFKDLLIDDHHISILEKMIDEEYEHIIILTKAKEKLHIN